MKSTLTLLATLSVLGACGAELKEDAAAIKDTEREPNLYECTTEDRLVLRYTTTSIAGEPQFELSSTTEHGPQSLASKAGAGIAVARQDDKQLVSVEQYVPDLSTTTWTVELPKITLTSSSDKASFDTTVTEVIVPTSIAGPQPGDETVTNVRQAKCVAAFAAF